jgi:hypothetical protein
MEGTWASMSAMIAGVKVCAIIYAWSKKGVSYFITTVGTTAVSPVKYITSWENDMGQTVTKAIDRLTVVSFIFQYVSEIDEHNRQRQNLIALEKCWPTKKCWEKLWLSVIDMWVVDLHRLYKCKSLTRTTTSQILQT